MMDDELCACGRGLQMLLTMCGSACECLWAACGGTLRCTGVLIFLNGGGGLHELRPSARAQPRICSGYRAGGAARVGFEGPSIPSIRHETYAPS